MIISRTPFRISFFGGGTDLPYWYEKYSVDSVALTFYDYVKDTEMFSKKIVAIVSKFEIYE